MRLADGRKEDPQIIINFGRGRDGRSRIRARTTLLDGDRWRKSLDEIDVWLFHSIEKLPSISRETFDVAALAFGVKRVEGQRRFPRTTQAGNNNQLFPRKFHVKVLEIVLASAANFDDLCRHSDGKCRTLYLNIAGQFLKKGTPFQARKAFCASNAVGKRDCGLF